MILADYSLPGYDGLSALAAVQKHYPKTPFIFVSGSLGEERAIETLHRGATDYVIKDRLARLGPAVRRALREREEMRKREQAQKERQESEEQFRAMFEVASIGMAQADPQTRLWLRVNQKMCAITGYSTDEMLQMRVCEITHPDDRQKDREEFERVVRGEASDYRLEKRYVGKNGAVAWVNVNMTVIRDAAGQPVRTMAAIEDITERKRAEASLHESEQRFRLLFNSGYDAVFVHQGGSAGNGPGKFIEVNDIACQRLGYTREELLQMTPLDISAPETLTDIPRVRAKLAVEKSAVSEGVHLTKDGRRIPVEISTHVFELNGVPTRLSTVRDITERKRAEETIIASEVRYRRLFEAAKDGILILDAQTGMVVDVNPFLVGLLGFSREAFLGKAVWELGFFKDIVANQASFAELQQKEYVRYDDKPLRAADGRQIDVEFVSNVYLVNQQKVIQCNIRDITERKRGELRIAAFASLGRRLNVAKTAREAGEIIVNVADDLLGWDACLFDLYSAAENRISHVLNMDLIHGRRAEFKQQYEETTPRKLSKRAIEHGGQLILRDHPEAVRPVGSPFGDTFRPSASIMFVPVRHGTEVVGVLSIQSYKPRAYDAFSLETLQALADHAGGALERLRAQEALGESEATFRSVWERSIDGMRLTDEEGHIIAVNEAFCRLVKLSREKLEGQIFSVAYKGHGPKDGIDVYQRRFATGDIFPRVTTQAQLWNGEEVDLEISTSFVELGRRGKMLLSIVRDVAERKRAELRIEAFSNLGQRLSAARSPAEAARAIYACADRFWKWDCGVLDLESAQPGWLETALAYDVVDGQRREVMPPQPVSPASAMSRRVMTQGAELILRKPEEPPATDTIRFGDASRLSASLMRVPMGAEGRTVGVLSIQSYTPDAYTREDLQMLQALADHCGGALDRLRTEQALQESERRFREMLETIGLVAMTLDTKGMITFCNDRLLRLTGWQRAEVMGADWFSHFIPETDDTATKKLFFDTIAAGTIPAHHENPIRTRKGELRQIVWNNTMLRDAAGDVIGLASIGEDITERKALEEQLRQSQKMEAVGQLAGGVAHDFNNMLAVIRGNAELLLMDEDQLTADTREGLKHVVEASERAANLTRQLLAFSRKQVLQPQPLVLNDVIVNLTKMLTRVIGENIDLQCHYAAPLPYVQADAGMMEQVRAKPEARVGEFVCLSVSDTGTGIAPEVLPRIFEPFFTTKEVGKGTGLGLATVYGIVQQHRGWVEVSSQVGKGTTFNMFLPAIPTPAGLAAAAEVGADVRGGNETILLVEDDHAVRMTTRRVLESKGYKVWEATSGREALDQWRSHAEEIALLLTDIIMPEGMTGRDLAERLWQQRSGLKVVFMSGYSADVVGKNTDFMRRTKSHFLQKPCPSRTLLETVRRCLDESELLAGLEDTGGAQ